MPSERLNAFMKLRTTARGVSVGQTCRLVKPFGCAAPPWACADRATEATNRTLASTIAYDARFMAAPRSASAEASAGQVVVADLGGILADFARKFSLRTP